MAKRQFTLNEKEEAQFKRAEDTVQDVRELRRLQAVRMYGTGHPVNEIIEITGCSWRALMDWCRNYRQADLTGLKSKWQGENALKLSREQRAEIKEKINTYRPDQIIAPHLRISRGQFWTVSDLKIVSQQWYGVSYRSQTSYHHLLHECRFSQQKPETRYRSRVNDLAVVDFELELEKK